MNAEKSLLTAITARVSHAIRNHLAILDGLVTTLQQRQVTDPQELEDSVNALLALREITVLLNLFSNETARQLEEVFLSDLLQSAFGKGSKAAGFLQLDCDINTSKKTIKCYPSLLVEGISAILRYAAVSGNTAPVTCSIALIQKPKAEEIVLSIRDLSPKTFDRITSSKNLYDLVDADPRMDALYLLFAAEAISKHGVELQISHTDRYVSLSLSLS